MTLGFDHEVKRRLVSKDSLVRVDRHEPYSW